MAAKDRNLTPTDTGTTEATPSPLGRPDSVTDIIGRAREALHAGDVTVREVVAALGRASYAPLLMLPALIVVTPASGIPLLSSVCGITIALISLQMILHRDHVWLPDWIMRRAVPRDRLTKAFDWLSKPAHFLDRVTKARLGFLVHPPVLIVLQVICFLSGAVMPLLEVLPFTSSMLGATVSLLAVAMVTRDGLLVLIAFAVLTSVAVVGQMILT